MVPAHGVIASFAERRVLGKRVLRKPALATGPAVRTMLVKQLLAAVDWQRVSHIAADGWHLRREGKTLREKSIAERLLQPPRSAHIWLQWAELLRLLCARSRPRCLKVRAVKLCMDDSMAIHAGVGVS